MGEAMKAILDFAQNEMKVKRVQACIYPDNNPSIKLAEKMGFAFHGQMKEELFRNEPYAHRIYVLTLPSNR